MSHPPPNGYMPGYNVPNGYNHISHQQQQQQHPQRPQYSPYQPASLTAYHQNAQHWHQNMQNQYPVNGYQSSAPVYQQSPPVPRPIHIHHSQQFVSPTQLFQHTPPQLQPEPPQQYRQPPPASAPLTTPPISISPSYINPSAMGAMASTNAQPDISKLLVSLAEEYFAAAHQLAPSIALSMAESEVEKYGELISTGLGCLATALKRVKLAPRVEAKIRLRYAGVLFEETDNHMEAETTLSHGIALCERNRYFDLKYAMQFLLAQFIAKKNPKAALKALDSHATEAQTYQHFSWVYAFRFLRASYSLQAGGHVDTHAAVLNLKAIGTVATHQQDYAIYMAASLFEAMAYMNSTASDAVQNVQSALAKAWANQLNVGDATQLIGIAHFIQVSCSIRQGIPGDMYQKLKEMQSMMDATLSEGSWSMTSGSIALPINRTPRSSVTVSQDTRTVLGIGEDGRDNLMLSFISAKDAYAINYLLCGMVNFQRNSQDQKASAFFLEGLKMLEGDTHRPKATPGILSDLLMQNQWRGQVICYLRAYLAFLMAIMGDWPATNLHIKRLEGTAAEFKVSLEGPLGLVSRYLVAVHLQGTGNFDAALKIYESKQFDLATKRSANASHAEILERDISILAALNRLSILQLETRRSANANTAIINSLESFCVSNPNKEIQTAFHLLLATIKTNPEAQIFEIKKNLKAALNGAQITANHQFTCITLNVMCDKFFRDVVGPQAEKSAQAAAATANKTGSPLWKSVAEGMLGKCYIVQGKVAEGHERLEVARRLAQQALPKS